MTTPNKEIFIYEFLNKLRNRLAVVCQKQHTYLCAYIREDNQSLNAAINSNDSLEYDFKSLSSKYFKYIESQMANIEQLTDNEWKSINFAFQKEQADLTELLNSFLADEVTSPFAYKIQEDIDYNTRCFESFSAIFN